MYQLPKANGPVIPQIPAVQGRRKFITISTEYQNPIKRITDSIQLDSFSQTEAYLRIIDFLQTLNSSVNNKKISDTCHESPIVVNIIKTLKKLEILVDEIPPEDTPQRFGNLSFRKWMEHLEQVHYIVNVSKQMPFM
jgi:serine/threonine-protein phosphatase 2A activator